MDRVWFRNYMEGVPQTIDCGQHISLIEMFETSVKKFPDHVAISNMGTKITYNELNLLSQYFANYLKYELKLEQGDRIAVMSPNLLQTPVAILGILRAGMTVVNVNPLYTPRELSHQLQDSGTKVILVLENFAHVVEQVMKKVELKKVIITSIGGAFSPLKRMIVNFAVRKIKKMVPKFNIQGSVLYRDAIKLGKKYTYKPADVSLDDVAFLQYTGGTTGVAKGAILTHANMVSNILQAAEWVSPVAVEGEETMVVALPLYHIFSLSVCFFAFLYFGAHCLLVTNPRDLLGFIKILSKEKFTFMAGVNTLYNSMMQQRTFKDIDFSNFKMAISGGMALQRPVAKHWHDLVGKPIIEGYGLTEASPIVTINPLDIPEFNHSVGLPISSTDVKIIDEQGETLGFDQDGELCVHGPQVMQGYWNHEDETKKVLSDDGWLKTGDIARMDKEGFLYIVDRKKDMIVVSGFNVYPNEIEEVIASMEGVSLVAVIGVPSQKTTECVKAFIVRENASLTEAEVIAHCRKNLTPYKVPKQIEFRYELPVSNVGKVLRRQLRDQQ